MLKTTNYKLNKIELTDSPPDITVINPNWDTIDSKLKTVENLTGSIKTKLDTVQNGAEVNIQSDWKVTNKNSDAFIKNKPDFQDILNNSPIIETKDIEFTGIVKAVSIDLNSAKIETDRSLVNEIPEGSIITYNDNGYKTFVVNSISDNEIVTSYTESLAKLYDSMSTTQFSASVENSIITKVSDFVMQADYTPNNVLTKVKSVDGINSGLDADLLDGKHASNFILKNCTKVNSRQEIKESGLYFMSRIDATDLPISGHDFIVLAMQYNFIISIIGTSINDTDYMYTCSGHSNDNGKTFIYGNWKKTNDNADAQKLKGIIPIKSGGTGADNIIDILKNLKLKNDSIFTEYCSAVLNIGPFKYSAKTSMTMLELAAAMPMDTSVIFRNAKFELPSISDAPTNYGEVLFIKGSSLNYMYALYFDCAINRDIYYWAASSNGIEKNWVKINDGGDADTIDGKHANEFATATQGTKADNSLPKSSYTASDILTKLKTVDGTGSGLDADLLDGYQINRFMIGEAGHGYGVSFKNGTSGLALEFKIDNTENLPVRKALEANSLQGKQVSDFSQGFYRKYTFTGSPQNWYRIAKTDFSAAGIFTIKADSPSYNSNTIFAVSSHRSQNIANITKLAHSSFNTLITAIRLVSKYENLTEQYIDIYIGGNISANTSIEFEVYFSGFNWQTIKPVSSNVPNGYATSVLNL